jgi:hypothetical protein
MALSFDLSVDDSIAYAKRIENEKWAGYRFGTFSDKKFSVGLSNERLCCEVFEIMILSPDGMIKNIRELAREKFESIHFGTKLICDYKSIKDIQICKHQSSFWGISNFCI